MQMVRAARGRSGTLAFRPAPRAASRSVGPAAALAALLAGFGAVFAFAPPAAAQEAYSFAAPPSAEANRVYGVNRTTGEVSVCQFERPEGSFAGITRCFAKGDGAGPQKSGNYELVATRYAGETGIFRVDRDSGQMSICYVRETPQADGKVESLVLCTAPAK